MTTILRRALLCAALIAGPTLAHAQTLSPLPGATISTPASGQNAQNFTYSCSVSGCATGTVVPAFAPTQGNALLSASNPLFMSLAIAGGLNAVGNPAFVSPGTGSVWNGNQTQLAGSTLAAPTAPGTPQTTGLVPTVNVANTNNNGAAAPGASSPVTPSNKPVGSAALATNQISCPITTATQSVAARTGVAGTGRISVTITNITGTEPIFIGNTGVTVSTGSYIPAVAGASLTLDTQAAIFCIASTAAQTISFVESF
jgi:hypothetical protein